MLFLGGVFQDDASAETDCVSPENPPEPPVTPLLIPVTAGEPVVLHTGARDLAGIARGVDERGALQLETAAAGIQSIYGGEISLRRAP